MEGIGPAVAHIKFRGTLSRRQASLMVRGDSVLTIPNPHRKEVSVDLLERILKRGKIRREDWLKAGQANPKR